MKTKTESKHTPTPWTQQNKNGKFSQYVLASDGRVVAACTMRLPLEADGNAALIVRAVNSHEALLEAAKRVKDMAIKTNGKYKSVSLVYMEILENAIAKAEGESNAQ